MPRSHKLSVVPNNASPIRFGGFVLSLALALCGCSESVSAAATTIQPVVLSAPQDSVRAGGSISLSATQGGKTLLGGFWAVVGPTSGTIEANGTYHAPANPPALGAVLISYGSGKLLSFTTLKILNPIPVISSVSPSVLTAPSTRVSVVGSGFLRTSIIMVNHTATATTYVDSSHLYGQVKLPNSATGAFQVAVRNPDPGAMLSSGVNVQIAIPLSPAVLPTATLHTSSYFKEQSDEFVGPFPSWTNVKTAFGAIGNGINDDTAAIQRAINSLTDDSASRVLFFPAGSYRISNTLVMGHMRNFSLVGENPATTTIKWYGAQHGTMLQADGSMYFKISRLSLDGSDTADIAEDLTTTKDKTYPDAYYSTFNEISDQHLFGAKIGLHLGIVAETTIQRVFFDRLSTAGVTVGDFNSLNIFVEDSLFLKCGTGLTDVYDNGSGSFVVTNSYFKESQVADMSIANTGPFTARHNTSVGSKTFFLALEIYDNTSTVTLQNNTILDPLTTPFQFGNLGPFTLIDNVVRLQNRAIPMIEASWSPSSLKDVFSIGNTYTPNGGIGTGDLPFQGRVVSYDDTTVPVELIPDVVVPSNVYIPPNLHRSVYEVKEKTGMAVQAAINLASSSRSQKPVVHLPKGNYLVNSTITFPVGSDIQLIGDDVTSSSLVWNGAHAAPVLAIPTSNVSLRNLRVDGAGDGTSDGILVKLDDQPNTQVIMDQTSLAFNVSYGVNFDGLEHATVEMFSTYATGSVTGVRATAGPFRAAKEGTLGITNHYTGSLQSKGTSTSFDVSAGGKYMVQDNWHDYGATSPQNFKLSGSGTVTEQGGAVYMNSATPFEIDNFDGNVTLMSFGTAGGFKLASTSGHANLLNLGLVGNSPNYLPSSTPNVTVGNVLNSYKGNHIPQDATPDVAWMREMLAQTRAEYPMARPALAPGANRIRMNRVWVDSALSAVHFVPDIVRTGLYYGLQVGGSGRLDPDGVCASTAPFDSSDQWMIMPAGEGDFELVSRTNGKALGFAGSADGTLALEPLTGAYDQRWMLNRLGDGNFNLVNRHTRACAGVDWTITAY